MDGVWVGFPDTGEYMDAAHPDELLLALDALEVESVTECIAVDVDCCLPQLKDILSQYGSASELVRHAIDFGYIWGEQGQGEPKWLDKWQAVMELEDCHRLDYALDLAQNLHCYHFMPRDMDLADFGKELAKRDGIYPKDELLATCFDAEGYANQRMSAWACPPPNMVLYPGTAQSRSMSTVSRRWSRPCPCEKPSHRPVSAPMEVMI